MCFESRACPASRPFRSVHARAPGCGRRRPRAPRRGRALRTRARHCLRTRSSVVRPVRSCPSQLNSVSRTRSGVGRMPSRAGKRIRRPRHRPPMMRIWLERVEGGRWRPSPVAVATEGRIIAFAPRRLVSHMFDLFKRKPDADARPWSERLKQGLGRSRELLTRPHHVAAGPEGAHRRKRSRNSKLR